MQRFSVDPNRKAPPRRGFFFEPVEGYERLITKIAAPARARPRSASIGNDRVGTVGGTPLAVTVGVAVAVGAGTVAVGVGVGTPAAHSVPWHSNAPMSHVTPAG